MSQLDAWLPDYDVVARHATRVAAPPEAVFAALLALDIGRSPAIRWLFRLRGLGRGRPELSLAGLGRSGFVELCRDAPGEIVFGLVARPWRPDGGIVRVDVEGFRRFHRPGFARIAWSFEIEDAEGGGSALATETRVQCLGARARLLFRLYWLAVGPFSGLTRREMLKLVEADAGRGRGGEAGRDEA
jgi:hypothetical protein